MEQYNKELLAAEKAAAEAAFPRLFGSGRLEGMKIDEMVMNGDRDAVYEEDKAFEEERALYELIAEKGPEIAPLIFDLTPEMQEIAALADETHIPAAPSDEADALFWQGYELEMSGQKIDKMLQFYADAAAMGHIEAAHRLQVTARFCAKQGRAYLAIDSKTGGILTVKTGWPITHTGEHFECEDLPGTVALALQGDPEAVWALLYQGFERETSTLLIRLVYGLYRYRYLVLDGSAVLHLQIFWRFFDICLTDKQERRIDRKDRSLHQNITLDKIPLGTMLSGSGTKHGFVCFERARDAVFDGNEAVAAHYAELAAKAGFSDMDEVMAHWWSVHREIIAEREEYHKKQAQLQSTQRRAAAESFAAQQEPESEAPEQETESVNSLRSLPHIIFDSENRRWQRLGVFGDHADYRDDDGNEVTIYHTEISGSGANTSAGYFHWY